MYPGKSNIFYGVLQSGMTLAKLAIVLSIGIMDKKKGLTVSWTG